MKGMQIFLTMSLLLTLLISMFGCFNASPTGPNGASGKNSQQQDQTPFEGGWELVSMNGQPMTLEDPITIGFANGKVGGFSGCNLYGGSYKYNTDGVGDSRIYLSNLAMTEMACLDQGIMQLEADYFRVLQSPLSDEYQEDHLILRSNNGQLTYIKSEKHIPVGSSDGDDSPVSSN